MPLSSKRQQHWTRSPFV